MTDCGHELYWRGMYRGTFGLITPESYAHPAKMAPRLCFRILEHLEELGLLHQGDTILDPMAGISTTLLISAMRGYSSIGIELEPKFVGFSLSNFQKLIMRGCNCGEAHNDTGYLRWLREAIQRQGTDNKGKADREIQGDILFKGMFGQSTEGENTKPRNESQNISIQSGKIQRQEQLQLEEGLVDRERIQISQYGNREGDSGASPSDGEVVGQEAITGGEGSSYQRGQTRQPDRKSLTNAEFCSFTNAQYERQHSKSTMSKVCETCGKPIIPYPVIIQGDARNLSTLLTERGLVTVSSPPYSDSHQQNSSKGAGQENIMDDWRTQDKGAYGLTPGQIGNLKDAPLVGITSPPYGEMEIVAGWQFVRKDGISNYYDPETGPRYGHTPGQIGNLPDRPITITSPPYGINPTALDTGHPGPIGNKSRAKENRKVQTVEIPEGQDYGHTEGQIGVLPDKPLVSVTSPPYDTQGHPSLGSVNKDNWGKNGHDIVKRRGLDGTCEIKGEDYLMAMQIVYAEIGKVSNVLACVVKNPTRNGKLRRLDLDTIWALQHCASVIYCCCRIQEGGITDAKKGKLQERLSNLREADTGYIPALSETQSYECGGEATSLRATKGKTKPIQREASSEDVYGGTDSDVRTEKGQAQPFERQIEARHPRRKASQLEGRAQKTEGALRENNRVEKISDESISEGQLQVSDVWSGDFPGSPHQGMGTESERNESRGLNDALPTMPSASPQRATGQDVQLVCPKCGKPALPVGKTIEDMSWKVICRHRAILFEEQEQGHLLDGSTKQVKGRLSFFKRLSYQKGQPVANFEDVILAVK